MRHRRHALSRRYGRAAGAKGRYRIWVKFRSGMWGCVLRKRGQRPRGGYVLTREPLGPQHRAEMARFAKALGWPVETLEHRRKR